MQASQTVTSRTPFVARGTGNDASSGGEDSDQYYVGDGWGKDSITEISSSASSQNMVLFVEPNKLTNVSVPATDDLTIKLHSDDGPEVKNASATSTIDWEGHVIHDVYGGNGDDHMTGNTIYGGSTVDSSGAHTVSTGAGDDEIDVDGGFGDDVVDCGESFSPGTDSAEVYYDSGDIINPNCEVQNP